MTARIPVIPHSEALIDRLGGRTVVIRVADAAEVDAARRRAARADVKIHCVAIDSGASVTATPLDENWADLPIALFASRLGPLRDFVQQQLPTIRKLNLRIYLPTSDPRNYHDLRILSSLGITTAVDFRPGNVAWDDLTDLMTYALLGLVKRGPIAPFNDIADQYDPRGRTDFGHVYFDDPRRFVHLDAEGRVALSAEDLDAGELLDCDIAGLDQLDEHPAYRARAERWREVFLQQNGCGYCPGWRVCLGRLLPCSGDSQGCRDFTTELMDVVEQYRAVQKRNKTVWRP